MPLCKKRFRYNTTLIRKRRSSTIGKEVKCLNQAISDVVKSHNSDVIMNGMAPQITYVSIVCTTVYSGTDESNIKVSRRWPLWREFNGHRWIPLTKGQWNGKCFHLMTSWWRNKIHPLGIYSRYYHVVHFITGNLIYINLTVPTCMKAWFCTYWGMFISDTIARIMQIWCSYCYLLF